MERREPTLSPGAISEPTPPAARRQQSHLDQDDDVLARPTRKSAPQAPAYSGAAPSSSLPAIALVIALVAAGGAGFLGWQLFQAQAMLKQADARIQGLEQQLNMTSEESSASVVTLQSNLKKIDGEVRRIADLVEVNRKAIAAGSEKTAAVGRDLANAQKAATDAKTAAAEAKTAATTLKQELTANKTVADGAAAKIDTMNASVSKQTKTLQELNERLDKMSLEMTALDSLAARLRNHDEAISAIDEFRRSTNRELLQIKQQLNTKP
jgi:chromosome segregation ATPase